MTLKIRTRVLFFAFACSLVFLPPASVSFAEQLLNINRAVEKAASDGVELIADNQFEAGFSATPACNSVEERACAEDTRYSLKSPAFSRLAAVKPVWEIRQWGSRSSFDATATRFGNGYGWATPEKRLVIYPGGRVEMAANGEAEFGGRYPTDGRGGPSLIAGQTIAAPGVYSRDTGSIDEMDRLTFNMQFRLEFEDQNKKAGYDPNRHAMILPVNFTVQNLNESSPG